MLIKRAIRIYLVNDKHITIPIIKVCFVIDKHIQMVTILAKLSTDIAIGIVHGYFPLLAIGILA